MTTARRAALALALALTGCTRQQPAPTPQAPHGGSLHKLSDGRNSVEVVQDGSGKPEGSKLLLYFCDAQFKPISPAPTSAKLLPRGRGASALEFKPTGDADPAKAGELACPPIAAAVDPSGELTATVDGKPVTAIITVR